MSPVSSSKVMDRGGRIQAPFTVSDISTCPGALYSENHPTSRSPWATGRSSVTVVPEVGAVENAAPWTKVGAADWPTAVHGSRAPRVAITARPADRGEGKYFKAMPSLTNNDPENMGELELNQALAWVAGLAGEQPPPI